MYNTIYTRKEPFCPWCDKAKELLKSNGISYVEIVIPTDMSREDYISKFFDVARPTVPLVFIDNQRIGGYEALATWFANKETTQ